MTQRLVALCDIDRHHLEAAARSVAKHNPRVKTFSDYRKLFDEAQREFDVVFVATPDHHHAQASMLAIQHGKHVYTEKPLTHSIYEARRLTEEARKARVATQMGNQGMASEEHRRLCEYIWAGAIGAVREVHIWTDRPIHWWPQGLDRPAYSDPVPEHLAWDLWLGPAPGGPSWTTGTRARRRESKSIIRSSGAGGGISARGRWATSPATPWRRRSGRAARQAHGGPGGAFALQCGDVS